jgi:hypothetical protein
MRTMYQCRRVLAVGLFALTTSVASAQTTAPITGEVLTIYVQGVPSPASAPVVLPRAQIQCGQPVVSPPPAGTVQNPLRAVWADPANLALDCVYTDPGTGVLAMLAADPSRIYEATLRFRTAVGDTAESPRSNLFTRPGVLPASPARIRIVGP